MPDDTRWGDPGGSFAAGFDDFVDLLDAGNLGTHEQLRRKDAMLGGLVRALGAIELQVGAAGGWRDVHHERLAGLTVRPLALIEEIFREVKPLVAAEGENASLSWTSDGLIEASPDGPPEPLRTVNLAVRADACGDQPVEIVDDQGQVYAVDARFVDGRFWRSFQVAAGRTLTVSCGDVVLGTYRVPPVP